eukprot:COSAG06_NODE_3268_length_5589_cov_69.631857_4_plen_198_part_00
MRRFRATDRAHALGALLCGARGGGRGLVAERPFAPARPALVHPVSHTSRSCVDSVHRRVASATIGAGAGAQAALSGRAARRAAAGGACWPNARPCRHVQLEYILFERQRVAAPEGLLGRLAQTPHVRYHQRRGGYSRRSAARTCWEARGGGRVLRRPARARASSFGTFCIACAYRSSRRAARLKGDQLDGDRSLTQL